MFFGDGLEKLILNHNQTNYGTYYDVTFWDMRS
jgi:hypothetical protein